MAGMLTAEVQRMFDALDKADEETAATVVSSEAQGIDEISRRWMRGPDEVAGYVRQLIGSVEDVHSEMHDPHEIQWGDTGVVTFWLEQDYTLEGERSHISAPTTVVFRRENDAWRCVLFHSLPLEPAS